MMYTCKLSLLIPHFKEDGKITALDYYGFKTYLYDGWGEIGISYFKAFPVREFIRGAECEADFVVIQCDERIEWEVSRCVP